MSADLIRLSDFVPEYARYYEVSPQEAAHDLYEIIESLFQEYAVRQGKLLPENVFWVGGARTSQPSSKGYELDFGGLRKYFKALAGSSGAEVSLLDCFCRADSDYTSIPARIVYSSRASLFECIVRAGIESPNFILGIDGLEEGGRRNSVEGLQAKELGYISKIISGLVNLVFEVDKAHSEQQLDKAGRERADKIKREASKLRNERKNFDLPKAILSLAEEAGVEMCKDARTFRRYMEGRSRPGKR